MMQFSWMNLFYCFPDLQILYEPGFFGHTEMINLILFCYSAVIWTSIFRGLTMIHQQRRRSKRCWRSVIFVRFCNAYMVKGIEVHIPMTIYWIFSYYIRKHLQRNLNIEMWVCVMCFLLRMKWMFYFPRGKQVFLKTMVSRWMNTLVWSRFLHSSSTIHGNKHNSLSLVGCISAAYPSYLIGTNLPAHLKHTLNAFLYRYVVLCFRHLIRTIMICWTEMNSQHLFGNFHLKWYRKWKRIFWYSW